MTFLNRKEKRSLEVILKKQQRSVIESLGPKTEALWSQAYENKQWITGKRFKIGGQKIDFSHFDFIVSHTQWTAEDKTSDLKMLKKFWIYLFPYIDKLINELHYYNIKFNELYDIENITIRKFALQNLELQCRQQFMKQHPEIEKGFKEFHTKFKAESDAKIVEIKAEEDRKNKIREEKVAAKKKVKKKASFAATIMGGKR